MLCNIYCLLYIRSYTCIALGRANICDSSDDLPFVEDLQKMSCSLSCGEVQVGSLVEHKVKNCHHVTRVAGTAEDRASGS